MSKYIVNFGNFLLQENNSYNQFYQLFSQQLLTLNIRTVLSSGDNIILYMDDIEMGTIRYTLDVDNWAVIDNIELKEEYRGKNIGYFLYDSLYQTAKKMGLNGLVSQLYSQEIGQKRSVDATRVLNKLIQKYGGQIVDVSDWIDETDDGDIYDYMIDGRNKIETIKA